MRICGAWRSLVCCRRSGRAITGVSGVPISTSGFGGRGLRAATGRPALSWMPRSRPTGGRRKPLFAPFEPESDVPLLGPSLSPLPACEESMTKCAHRTQGVARPHPARPWTSRRRWIHSDERLKTNPALERIPVIVISARDPVGARDRALEAEAAGFMQKPPDNDQLLGMIRSTLGEST
jgi:hypothetical protein